METVKITITIPKKVFDWFFTTNEEFKSFIKGAINPLFEKYARRQKEIILAERLEQVDKEIEAIRKEIRVELDNDELVVLPKEIEAIKEPERDEVVVEHVQIPPKPKVDEKPKKKPSRRRKTTTSRRKKSNYKVSK